MTGTRRTSNSDSSNRRSITRVTERARSISGLVPTRARGRFGGAVDDLRIFDQDRVVFEEHFDEFKQPRNRAKQADTGQKIFWGMQSPRWKTFGVNSLHMVEYEAGNLAAQIFSGWQDTKFTPETAEEKKLQNESQNLTRQLTRTSVFTAVTRQPGVMRMLIRGDAKQLGTEVAANGLRAINGVPADFAVKKDASDEQRRRRLADWITHPGNGPFHRTIVNRIWHYHFGRGIVATPNDLGFNGSRPTHPDLLDWLSVWFREQGYSLKKLHRLILTSATYQQASAVVPDPRAVAIDRDNQWLWRQRPRRLDAETVRDSLLSAAGALNSRAFGPGYRDVKIERVGSAHYYRAIDPTGTDSERRTIYRWRARGERSSLLETFDCPDPSATTPKRSITTTPSQALSHWNHAFVLRMANRLAARIEASAQSMTNEQRVQATFRFVLSRNPAADELASSAELVRDHGLPLFCRVLFNCSEAIVID